MLTFWASKRKSSLPFLMVVHRYLCLQ